MKDMINQSGDNKNSNKHHKTKGDQKVANIEIAKMFFYSCFLAQIILNHIENKYKNKNSFKN